jgi:hypothetical protein
MWFASNLSRQLSKEKKMVQWLKAIKNKPNKITLSRWVDKTLD